MRQKTAKTKTRLAAPRLAPTTSLVQMIDDALLLLEQHGPDTTAPAGSGEELTSLLGRCEALLAQRDAAVTPVRVIHGFVLAKDDPLAGLLTWAPRLRVIHVSSLALPIATDHFSDVEDRARAAALRTLQQGHTLRGLDLVQLRDHQARYADTLSPGLDPIVSSPDGPVRSVVLVRHPLLSYLEALPRGALIFRPATLEAFSDRYLAFLSDHAGLPRIRVEEIEAHPATGLRDLFQALQLPMAEGLFATLQIEGVGLGLQAAKADRSGVLLRYGDGTPATEEPLDTPSYRRLCERLGYDPDHLPPEPALASWAGMPHALRRPLPPRPHGRTFSRFQAFLPLIARVTEADDAPPGQMDTAALVAMVEDCLGHPEGFYEALDDRLRYLSHREAALLLIGCAAHHAGAEEAIHAVGLLAEAADFIAPGDRSLRLLAAEVLLRLRKPNLALEMLTADALEGPLALEPDARRTLREALQKYQPVNQGEHGHALLLAKFKEDPPRPLDRPRVLIEIGTTRERVPGQGSTEKLALACAEMGIDFITVDMDPRNSAVARRMFRRLGLPFRAINAKGEDFLAGWTGPIDYCFLDAYDFDHGKHSELRQSRYEAFLGSRIADAECHQMHLDCAVSLVEKLSPDGVICFDDTWTDDHGAWTAKGTTAMPYLLSKGFKVIESRDRAALLVRG